MRLGGELRGEFEDRFGGGMGGDGMGGGGMGGGGGMFMGGREIGGGGGGFGPDSRPFGGDSALGTLTGLSAAASIALSCSKLLSSQQLLALGLSMQFLDVFGIKPDGFASNRVFVANVLIDSLISFYDHNRYFIIFSEYMSPLSLYEYI